MTARPARPYSSPDALDGLPCSSARPAPFRGGRRDEESNPPGRLATRPEEELKRKRAVSARNLVVGLKSFGPTTGEKTEKKEESRAGNLVDHPLPALLSFELLGEPVPKARARTVRAKGSAVVRTFTPAATRAFEERVRLTCMVAVSRLRWTWTKACRFGVVVRVVRTHADAGGDVDNYAKAVLDGIKGVAFADDRYVRSLVASLEEPDGARPRIEVEVRRLAAATRAA